MRCDMCGTELPEGAINYCPRCGAATIHVVPERGIASSGTSGPTMASSSNAGEQYYPSNGHGSAPSATMLQEHYGQEYGQDNPFSASQYVPLLPSPQQSMGPSTPMPPPGMAPPGLVPWPQQEGPPSSRRGFARSKGMIALLIGLAFLIIVGSVSFLLYSNSVTTNREHAAATATAHTNATSTAKANATAHANATATFIASHYPFSNNLALEDPLNDNSKSNGWDTNMSSDGKAGCQFTGGAYHAVALDPRYFTSCFAYNTTFVDFTYQVEMTIVKGDSGGIGFRFKDSSGYLVFISTQGYYELTRFDGNTNGYKLVVNGASTAIKTGLNQTNLIAVVARGNTLELYVNEQFITRVVDNTYNYGQIGVLASPFGNSGNPTEVVFSNAKVWKL